MQSNRIPFALWNVALKPRFCHGTSDKISKKLDFACFDWWVEPGKFSLLMVWTGRRWRRKSKWWGRWEETASTSFCLRLVNYPRSNTTLIGENWSDIYQVRGESLRLYSNHLKTTPLLNKNGEIDCRYHFKALKASSHPWMMIKIHCLDNMNDEAKPLLSWDTVLCSCLAAPDSSKPNRQINLKKIAKQYDMIDMIENTCHKLFFLRLLLDRIESRV